MAGSSPPLNGARDRKRAQKRKKLQYSSGFLDLKLGVRPQEAAENALYLNARRV